MAKIFIQPKKDKTNKNQQTSLRRVENLKQKHHMVETGNRDTTPNAGLIPGQPGELLKDKLRRNGDEW